MKLVLSFMLTIVTLTSSAQVILSPSKKSFEKKWIKNDLYLMIWYGIKDSASFEMGRVTTQVSKDNRTVTVITQVSVKNAKAPWVDSTIADVKTLRPIRHSSYNAQRDMVLDFGKIVTGYYDDKTRNIRTVISDTTNNDYFDSNIIPVLIGWLPLQDNYKQAISMYNYNPNAKSGVSEESVTNVYSSTYQTDKKGIRNVWVVTVSQDIGNGEKGSTTYFFDKADRKLWKMDIDIKGTKMMMKRVE